MTIIVHRGRGGKHENYGNAKENLNESWKKCNILYMARPSSFVDILVKAHSRK